MMHVDTLRSAARSGTSVALLALLLAACGGGGGGHDDGGVPREAGPNEGEPVGSPCTSDSECDSPTSPECLEELRPLASLAGVPQELAELGLEFPSGYCSSVLSCASDADCGDQGGCYRPFREVSAQTLRDLEPPLGVSAGSLDFLPGYGVCLRTCTSASSCESGQKCEAPLADFVGMVPGAINDVTYCVPDGSGPIGPNDGDPVGSACDADLDCDSPTSPDCLAEIKPLSSIPGVPAELADLGLEFPNGYCSSIRDCGSNDDCGDQGGCYRPFREVSTQTLRELEVPLGAPTGALDFLPAYGICLRPCTSADDCEIGQLCEAPLNDLVSLVPGAINDTSFCVPDPACADGGCTAGPCSPNPCLNGGTCVETGSTFECDCPVGYDGATCENQTIVPDRVIGQSCESDAECAVRGTARCLTEVHPLEGVLPPGYDYLERVGLDFDRGYCSNQPNCASNIECGPNGRCLAPFRDVTDQTLRDLETTFTPNLAVGALDFLGGYGVCLRACDDNMGCFSDQACDVVMEDLISQVPGSANSQTFCVPHPDCEFCSPNAYCAVDANGDGTCTCRPGFTGNGTVCNATGAGACATNPCQNAGDCTDGANGAYTCACQPGYRGTHCQIATVCTPNPCVNEGVCQATSATTYMCMCKPGYSGATCQNVTICPSLTAPTNGNLYVSTTTNAVGTVAQAECNQGYALSGSPSRTCQANGQWSGTPPMCVSIGGGGPCASNPCQNGGVCTPGAGTSYTCSCSGTGYTGATCSTPVDCGSLGTLANGTIVTTPSSSTTFGTTAMYACNPTHTLVGGASRTCQASGQWSGTAPTCQLNTGNACSPNPCLNGGTCEPNGGSYTCDCADGYSGMNCQTPNDCGALTNPTNGTVSAPSTTMGATATYSCNQGFSLSGSATRTCGASGWTGSAPTCQASSCGSFTDIVYRLTGTFEIKGTPFGVGDQTFTGLTNNANTPAFQGAGNTTPFTGSSMGGTFTRGFARLRFTNNAAGQPIAGTVRLVEWYMPLEFQQTAGAQLTANNDHSVGIINMPGSLSNCGGGNAACTNHAPTVNRACTSNASGTLSGTTLSWGACTPAWTGSNSWSYANSARSATGAGCAMGYVQYGNNATDSSVVPASGKGDAYQVYNQQLANITFSNTSYLTATWTMAKIQIPNGTGQSNTWLTITSATPIATDCGTTPGTDLVCNLQ